MTDLFAVEGRSDRDAALARHLNERAIMEGDRSRFTFDADPSRPDPLAGVEIEMGTGSTLAVQRVGNVDLAAAYVSNGSWHPLHSRDAERQSLIRWLQHAEAQVARVQARVEALT